MIAHYDVALDEAQHALATALHVEHSHGGRSTATVTASVDIPDDIVGKIGLTLSDADTITDSAPLCPKYYGYLTTRDDLRVPSTTQISIRALISAVILARLAAGNPDIVIRYDPDITGQIDAYAAQIAEAQLLADVETIDLAESRRKSAIEEEERDVRRAAEEREKAENEAARKKIEDEAAQVRQVWIAEKGSDVLKLGHTKGYACQKRYAQEWGMVELGADYVLDYDGKVSRKTRSCPSEGALNEQVRIEALGLTDIENVQVVWLPDSLEELDEDYQEGYNEPTPCEAVEVKAHHVYYYKTF